MHGIENEIVTLVVTLLAGMVLGGMFFGGLWWTVRKGVFSKRPASLFLLSLLLRTGIALLGFYWIGQNHWERWLGCLVGFVIARFLAMKITDSLYKDSISPGIGVNHAP